MTLANCNDEVSCVWNDEDLRMTIESVHPDTTSYHCGYRYSVNFLGDVREARTVFLRNVVIINVISRIRALVQAGRSSASVAESIADEFDVEPYVFSVVV